MIDIEKFICSLLADHPIGVTVREDIHKALKDQGLEYKDGKIVSLEGKTALKESEDEKIRKAIIESLPKYGYLPQTNIKVEDAIAWLEKQGKKGTNGNEREIPNSEQKPTGKVEPIEWSGKIKSRKVEGVLKKMLDEKIKSADKVEPKFKVGDKIRKKTPSSFDRDMQVARIEKDYYVCNHIGKFSSEVVLFSKESSYDLIEQKTAWGEEDEETLKIIDRDLQEFYSRRKAQAGSPLFESQMQNIRWLKSLKDRVGCEVICTTKWKPSSEQMKYLCKYAEQNNYDGRILTSLYNDLKKLKG